MQEHRRRIVELLRVRGSQTVQELAQALRLTRTAIVSHLNVLRAEGLVRRNGLRPGRRRPSTLYAATPKADAMFPKAYEEFAASLLGEIKREDPGSLSRVLGRICDAWVQRDLPRVEGLKTEARLERVRQILTERGFLPTLERSDAIDGRYILREHNCPVMGLAAAHPEVCNSVHRWLETLFGISLTRTRCMRQGDPFSEYVVQAHP